MAAPSRYPVPARTHRTEEEVRRSRFITTLERVTSVEAAADFIRRVSEEFADATHNCWAYVVGPPGSTDRIGMSDDGEPHGTAGRPMLNALLHGGLGDVAAVVTRYYGGVKLGTGGLVRAYGGSLQQALLSAPRAEHVDYRRFTVVVDYPAVDTIQQLLPTFEAEVLAQHYLADVTYELRLPSERVEAFRGAVLDATRGQGRIQAADAGDDDAVDSA
ncbi:MAG TPA: YigZ family protein [Gemmatimonadaceae bacterium]|nr:YigZ family protein [Gemmatimonadaceae bacterium]